jgi:hypothetical protein
MWRHRDLDEAYRRMLARDGRSAERKRLLGGLEVLTPFELAARAGVAGSRAASHARQLRQQRLAFAVADHENWLFPAFQFVPEGRPRLEMRYLIELFDAAARDEWQLLEFCVMPHVLLPAPPMALLSADAARVLRVAEWEVEVEC